ncbi:MAG: hypothetical protein H6712_34030 [Myxococcales bacterium]|nr:hypothetical protein [Myxococcales bacterium]MCB9718913.1 hypothetical protein [Myxococcales bacterium]
MKATWALPLLLCGLAGCPTEPAEDLDHGIINIEFKRGQSETSSPYDGTSRVEVTLLYLECLIDFYDANPDYQQYGPEGALVFGTREDGGEGWLDRLCDTERAGQVDCQVESFRQELDAAKQLTIHYTVSGEIEDRLLPFGPLPEPDLAMCEAGGQPIVRVGSMGAVRGLDGNGDTVWNTEAFSPSEAATGQGAPITIRAARAN